MAFAHLSKWHLQKGWGPDRLNGFGSQQEKRAKVTMGITGWILMQFTQRDSPSRGAAKTYQGKTLSIDIDCASVFDIRRASASSKQHERRIIFSFVKSFHLSLLALIRSVWFNRHLWRIMVNLTRHSVGEQSRNHTEPVNWIPAMHAGLGQIAFKWIVKSSAQMVRLNRQIWLNSQRESH